jgi:tripartite ATP-independent transporter DctP family solute receptor
VAKATKGRYACAKGGASQGAEADMVDGLAKGSLDVAHVGAPALATKVPEVGIVEVPYLFRDIGHARRAMAGKLGAELNEKLAAHKVMGLAWTEHGFHHLSNSKRAVVAPADLSGLKVRTQDSAAIQAGFKALGAEAVGMPFPEVLGALEKGTLDGQEHLVAVMDEAKFFRAQKHVTLTNHAYVPALLAVSGALWDKLSPAERKAFAAAAAKASGVQRAAAGREHHRHLATMKKNGVKVVQKVNREAFRKAAQASWAELGKAYGAERMAAVQAIK